ncbi:RNA polymerase factor sigma C [Peribacillus butanolivorans]|uniref:sigma-70 family RNA polymerase sigma factor n=1 Tax=Peribacillus butanolivorans TaxID=421767 RepID=UPI0006A6F1B2|nr:sigma-70 family RNA polymerase sigma factor [Peribacillus butanolivorans]KON70303.1 RNA polymerase factor sigma C [Peribacillus butanolivorans]
MEELFTEYLEAGEEDIWLDEIMTVYGQDILQLVYSYVKNLTVAEDLTQEIFVKCYKALPTYKKQSKLRTWLWKIAINHCKDYLKSWYHRNIEYTVDERVEPQATVSVEETILKLDEDQMLSHTLMNLPIKYREVIYLFYFQELSIKEISEMTGISQGTIKTRMRRAKAMLKEKLEGDNDGR